MDGSSYHVLPMGIRPDRDRHDLAEAEELPTEHESYLLGLCGVSAFTGLHHVFRSGLVDDYTECSAPTFTSLLHNLLHSDNEGGRSISSNGNSRGLAQSGTQTCASKN